MKPLRNDEVRALASMKAGQALDADTINLFGRLLDETGRSRALLKRIEWAQDGIQCPECKGYEPESWTGTGTKGHRPGCELAALIGGTS